jgi:hypothetical protein
VTQAQLWRAYLAALKTDFVKLCKLEFLQPDGSVAFVLDNNDQNPRSAAFIQEGSISVNLNNGQRRTANVTLSNLDNAYDYNINKVWFGQQIRLSEGLILPNGTEFYLPQGVFYIKDPEEVVKPGQKTASYPLVDKWAYLDGTLFGKVEGIYEVPVNSNIFEVVQSVLALPRGNGRAIDNTTPVFTNWYNGKTTALPDGTIVPLTNTPYTARIDSDNGSYADVLLDMNTMLAGWMGYDATGALRIDPSQDDIIDATKPIQYAFTPTEKQFLGATYTVKNSEMYNDVIVMGEALGTNPQARARAVNQDPASDTNIYTVGRKTNRLSQSGYYTNDICESLAVFKLKRMTVLQKSVTIESQQMFHLTENNLVTVTRPDRGGAVERHLLTGFTRPLGQIGAMTLSCTAVNDFPVATIQTDVFS